MKRSTLLSIILLLVIVVFAAAFTTKKTTTYKVDTEKSTLIWNGKKVAGEHLGTIKLKEGTLLLEGNKLKGGSFVIDMNTITCSDLSNPAYNTKLVTHLKSDDFFSVEKFPEATLEITKALPEKDTIYKIKGNITIKGITQAIEFPATITHTENRVKATAKVAVNRAKHNVRYGSGSFFANLGNKVIDDIFTLDVTLVANK